jgi:anhydro-N-acetylmuramic acid kinase
LLEGLTRKRRAWDICPANIVLNKLAQQKGLEFDRNGDIGRSGKVITSLLEALENLDFYKAPPPKSLGTEWLEEFIFPLIKNINSPVEDVMATFYEHTARRIAHDLNSHSVKDTLFTGGGVKNSYLISLTEKYLNGKLIIPEEKIVDYKEAIGFAYLGILRVLEMPNCLATVTGAARDSSSGVVNIIN